MTTQHPQGTAEERPDIILDLARLNHNCHNNPTIIKELIRHLLDKSGPKWIKALETGLAATDKVALEETCHSIKGSAATVFAWRISNLGLKLEHLAREGRLEEIRASLPDLLREFDELRNWAAQHIHSSGLS